MLFNTLDTQHYSFSDVRLIEKYGQHNDNKNPQVWSARCSSTTTYKNVTRLKITGSTYGCHALTDGRIVPQKMFYEITYTDSQFAHFVCAPLQAYFEP